jgi:two-component system nitrogen regulation response regulator GlnG
VGRTPVMQGLYRMVARIMNSDLPVLVQGESGTGKTLIARMIHDLSDRRGLPLVTVSPGELNDLDGPAKLMARARGGTILLDEIADFDSEAQGRVVRMMDAPGEDRPRFLATLQTRDDSSAALRDDLFYRLSGAVIEVPALRDRVEDVALLARHFLSRAERTGQPPREVSEKALDLFRRYGWPGNVRQLENTVLRLGLTSQTAEITEAEARAALGAQPQAAPTLSIGQGTVSGDSLQASVAGHVQRYFDLHGDMLPPAGLYQRILREMEIPLIEISLDATGGNQAKCADLLGINRNTLRKKITELDIRVTRRRKLV